LPTTARIASLCATLALSLTAACADRPAPSQGAHAGAAWVSSPCALGAWALLPEAVREHLSEPTCALGGQQTLVTATFRVPGARAAEIEAELVRDLGMGALRFACCGWEPRDGRLGAVTPPSGSGLGISVEMTSEETLIDRRAGWGEIDSFYVAVVIGRW